jgi:hypothetical protein
VRVLLRTKVAEVCAEVEGVNLPQERGRARCAPITAWQEEIGYGDLTADPSGT